MNIMESENNIISLDQSRRTYQGGSKKKSRGGRWVRRQQTTPCNIDAIRTTRCQAKLLQ